MPTPPQLPLDVEKRWKIFSDTKNPTHDFSLESFEQFLASELQTQREELERVGFRVRIVFSESSPFVGQTEILENITEIHYNYPSPVREPRIAFESDIDGTGITYQISYIKEFESLPTARGEET